MGKIIDIGGRIHNPEVGNVVTGANEILDDTKNKKQDVINSEVDAALEALDANKQDNLTFDQTPTESSTNPVTSGGVYAADLALQQAIEAILTLIPSAASALNQLADKSFVNSSIATASSTFRGTYNLVSDLHLSVTASHQDIATALASVVSTADNNDYCFVQIPTSDTSSDIRVTERYKFNGTAWAYEYDLNNSGFTATQWEAINSGITALLVTKLGALPTAAELATSLAGKQNVLTFDNVPVSGSDNPVKSSGLYQLFTAIDAKFPSDASSSNKLVAENRLAAYVTAVIGALDATFDLTSADGHVTFRMTQTNGVVTSVQILTSDIASASALTTLGGRVSTNETDIANLQAAYAGLTQSDVIVVNGALPSSGQQQNKIYRQPDQDHTPPQFYSDYMWNGSAWVLMATYNNAIDDVPTYNSNNLVKSGGVFPLIKTQQNYYGRIYDGVILSLDNVAAAQVLFDKRDVVIGETINYSFKLTGVSGAIDLRDTNNQRIAYYGKDGGGTPGETVTGSFTIPSNFGLAHLTAWNAITNLVLSVGNEKVVDKRLDELEIDILPFNQTNFAKDYFDQNVTLYTYLLNRWMQEVNEGFRHADISVIPGEKYKVNGNCQGANFPLYILALGNTVVDFYSPTYGVHTGVEVTIPSGVNRLIVNGESSGDGMVKVFKLQPTSEKVTDAFIVGKTDGFDYNTVNQAVLAAGSSGVVEVDYGEYETEIENLATNKRIIGRDKNLCKIYNNSGDYSTPPIEIAGGVLKNLFVFMDGTGKTVEHTGYCLHSDDNACENNTLIVEDCIFNIKNSNHAVGIGAYGNEEIIFKNCTFVQQSASVSGLFLHNSGGDTSKVGIVRFHDCYFESIDACMKLKRFYTDCKVKFEFINCTLISETYGTTDDCVRLVAGDAETPESSFNGNFELMPSSHGNNIALLNYD